MKIRLKQDAVFNGLKRRRVYEVISVGKHNKPDARIFFTVFDDEIYQPLSVDEFYVEIVDPRIDADWVMRVDGYSFWLIHRKLSHPDFWEDFYGDEDANAKALLKEVYPEYEAP